MRHSAAYLMPAMLLLALSCQERTVTQRHPVSYVTEIISDASCAEHKLLYGRNPDARDEAIFLAGPPEEVFQLARAFMKADYFDNSTGGAVPDSIPDFSGETFAGILDELYSPYGAQLAGGNETLLREVAAKAAVMAVDTSCFVSPYDREGGLVKVSSKLIVLTSSCMAAYGQFDVDTLFRALGCNIPVLSPLQCMMDEIFAETDGEDVHVGVVAPRSSLSSGVYSSLFSAHCRNLGLEGSRCTVLAGRDSVSVIAGFFDDYIASGATEPLDYLIVDDFGADREELLADVSRMVSVMSPESLKYREFFAKDFKLLTPAEAILKGCYAKMRSNGLFSFRISRPASCYYLTVRAPESLGRSFMLIPFTERYASESTLESYTEYVQD
ncbi:MAG: hypothetical protein J5764_02195 [Bacteroidales bacterium]|nr:hypothetical protein [Bacteroidales bacterium]